MFYSLVTLNTAKIKHMQASMQAYASIYARAKKTCGLVRDLNPGPLAPKARIMPLDQRAFAEMTRVCTLYYQLVKYIAALASELQMF